MGLDISTKAGIALLDDESLPPGTMPKLCLVDYSKHFRGIERAAAVANDVIGVVNEWGPKVVIVEGYSYASKGNSLTKLVEVGAIVRYLLRREGHYWQEAAPNTLKKFATGNGQCDKTAMALSAFKRFKVEGQEDEIDAFWAGMFGLAAFGSLKLPKEHMKAVENWRKSH